MRKIIACLYIGTNELKLLFGEILKNKLNILACVETKSRGIKKGYVVNNESAMEAFLEIFKKAEEIIGIPIKKVICIVPSLYADCFLAEGAITIKNENRCVTHKEIIKVLQAVVYNKVVDNRELVTILTSLILVYIFNLVVGLLPVFTTIRKTPAQILSRQDIN